MKQLLISFFLIVFVNFIFPIALLSILDMQGDVNQGDGGSAVFAVINFIIITIHIGCVLLILFFFSDDSVDRSSWVRAVVLSNCLFNFIWILFTQIFNRPDSYSLTGYFVITVYFIIDFGLSFYLIKPNIDD